MKRGRRERPALFISWSVRHGRSRDLAAALGAEAVFIGIRRRRRRWLAPIRYVFSTLQTIWVLAARRPRAVVVMMPPSPLAVVALGYGRLARVPVALDAHTAAVHSKRTGRTRHSLAVLGRLATATVVTNGQLAEPLRKRGINALIVHDPPILFTESTDGGSSHTEAFRVVAPLSWAPDEPIEQIIDAARRCPEIPFVATGRAPATIRQRADLPPNLELAGFLQDEDFRSLMSDAGVVLALTTREATMQRAGYEAMALGRPVVASNTRVLRDFFGRAALYAGDGAELAEAITATCERREELAAAMRARHEATLLEFEHDVAALAGALGLRS